MRRIIIKREKRNKLPLFVKIIVVPISLAALIFAATGVYAFKGANELMRIPPKVSEQFPVNILPAYSNAYFTSIDGLTSLRGWFFETGQEPVSTVIMIHGSSNNRLQFDSDTVTLYSFFLDRGFNVLSFDLRHSGDSSGDISTFGYTEWQDVIGAIDYAKRVSPTRNVILYGFGSGAAAGIIALDELPEPDSTEDIPYNIETLGITRDYIIGMILHDMAVTPDDYISAAAADAIYMGEKFGRHVIPYAIRLSAGVEERYNLASILSRADIPVHLIHSPEDDLFSERVKTSADERKHIFPEETSEYLQEETPGIGRIKDMQEYLDSIQAYLDEYILDR